MKEMEPVTVTTVVAVDPPTAFRIFTNEVDSWWKRGPSYRVDPNRKSAMRFEDGRFIEAYEGGEAFEHGRVIVWDPPARLVFEMRGRNFRPGETTEVEVRFERVERGTRVTVEHRGWDGLPGDHPARHGFSDEMLRDVIGTWWSDLVVAMRVHIV